MYFLTAYDWQEQSGLSLALQQAVRSKGELPLVFAGIFKECKEGEHREEKGGESGCFAAERMTDWFYERALSVCERKGAEACVDAARGLFEREVARMEKEGILSPDAAFAVFFAMGEECFYAWRGDAQLKLFNRSFDRANVRKLTWQSPEMVSERAGLEEGVGVLIGMEGFFDVLSEDVLKSCLEVAGMRNETQVQRHLSEVSKEAARKGAEEIGVILAVAREESGWREN